MCTSSTWNRTIKLMLHSNHDDVPITNTIPAHLNIQLKRLFYLLNLNWHTEMMNSSYRIVFSLFKYTLRINDVWFIWFILWLKTRFRFMLKDSLCVLIFLFVLFMCNKHICVTFTHLRRSCSKTPRSALKRNVGHSTTTHRKRISSTLNEPRTRTSVKLKLN